MFQRWNLSAVLGKTRGVIARAVLGRQEWPSRLCPVPVTEARPTPTPAGHLLSASVFV